MDPRLNDAIERAVDPSSNYWWGSSAIDQTDAVTIYEVEIRIDVPAGRIDEVNGTGGWVVAERDVALEAVFLRRHQPLDQTSIASLIRDGITIAFNHSGRFHSWIDIER
jgi:hypothetical protein